MNPPLGQDFDWVELSNDKSAYLNKMKELNFITAKKLGSLLYDFEGISQNSEDQKNIRRFKIVEFFGQLEMGSENKKPHYNLLLRSNIKILSSTLVRELSKLLYNSDNCKSINVEPSHDTSSLISYCTKEETRLTLENTDYYPPSVDYRVALFLDALHENSDLLKYLAIQDYFKK